MYSVPERFSSGPFHRSEALDAGVPRAVVEGVQFRRLHQGVYVHRDHEMTWEDLLEAARLALPADARTTGATRLQQLGLDVGPRTPLHFVVQGDLHLRLEGVFLNRTVRMPPHDEDGVRPEAAYVAFCAESRLLDAITAGCALLREGLLDLSLLDQIIVEEWWRRGVPETRFVLPYLDERCRSLPEAALLAYVMFAGLPIPLINHPMEVGEGVPVTPDQWYADYRLAVEFDGSHHQQDRGQYVADIDRYATYRREHIAYEVITKERMRSPKATVRQIYAALVERGYVGPEPDFDEVWPMLFRPLTELAHPTQAA